MGLTVGQLLSAIDRYVGNGLLTTESEVIIKVAGKLAPEVEIALEQKAVVVSCHDLPNGAACLRVIGFSR